MADERDLARESRVSLQEKSVKTIDLADYGLGDVLTIFGRSVKQNVKESRVSEIPLRR